MAMKTVRRRWWIPFGVLCVVASSRWIVADQWPRMGSTLRSEAWACAIGAVAACAVAIARRRQAPRLWDVLGTLAVGGGLLAAPALGAALRGPAGEPLIRTVALCFVPVVVILLSGILTGQRTSLWPGLAGLGGALLVLPLTLPSDVLGWVWLIAPPVAVSVACVACRKVARLVAVEWSASLLFAGGAVGLVLIEAGRVASSGVSAQSFSLWGMALDALLTGLVVLVVLQMDGLRYAARYFAIPLLTIVETALIVRSGVTLRLCAGMVLLAAGAVGLLRARGGDDEISSLHLV
ncbi:MAG: hypothetical protein ABI147_14985 [Acidobacteriaceae bacterium]